MDAIEAISKKGGEVDSPIITTIKSGKVLVRMTSETGSWTTPSGVKFTSTRPFQLLSFHEADSLIKNNPERFSEGKEDELKKFYGL